jgi:AraC-like DNA-binding protein
MTLNRVGNVSMFLVWLLSLKLFDDNFKIRRVHPGIWVLAITSLIMRSIGSYYANYAIELGAFAYFITWVYSQFVLLGFSLTAVYVAVKGFRSDLVIERRYERVIFVICVAILLLLMAGNRGAWVINAIAEGTFSAAPLPPVLYSIYAYFVTVALFFWKFRVVDLLVFRSSARSAPDKVDDEQFSRERKLSAQIKGVMEKEKLYHESSLTVPVLAAHVASQEYLVRRAINNHMGYRNFSEFLNHYRINETIQLLSETDDPITSIGMDVGYTSLSSFYKAFKTTHGVTPKQYRAQHSEKP